MPAMRRSLNDSPSSMLSEIGGLMGPLGLPGALAGVIGKGAKMISPEDLNALQELLGKPIMLGKKLMRLSSADPAANKAILHASTGERVATPIDDLLKAWRTIGEDTGEAFPEGAVVSAPGVKAPEAMIGPKGGLGPLRRTLK